MNFYHNDDVRLIVETYDKLLDSVLTLRTCLSEIEKTINGYVHMIEYLDLSGPDMSKITKELKKACRLRRHVKERIIILQCLKDSQCKKHISLLMKESEDRQEKYMKMSSDNYEEHFKKNVVN